MTASPGVQAPRHARAVSRLHLLWPFAACLLPAAAVGQSFDCTKASNPVDRAICASPRLRQLDSELATAYAAALKRDPAQTDLIRQAQRSWASGRSACVAPVRGSGRNTPAEQCLATAYATRLAALAPPAATATEAPRAPARATTSPTAAGPAAASPATSPASTASSAAAAVFATPRPAAGLPSSPTAAGTLERDKFPTAGETDVLLHVTSPGRFAIRAGSPTGTALQLVDMLTGPGERQGFPGKQDGRIDALLDTGTYKLRAFGDKGATGDTTLTLSGFSAAGTALLAPGYQPLATTLGDLQVRDFWFAVPDGAGPVRIEAAGRSLARLALWRDGRDLVDLPAATNLVSATPAHPMTDIVLSGPLPPGTYRLTAYGGPKLSWTDGATEEPLYVRTGRSDALLSGGASGSVGVFGSEAFDVPAGAARAMAILPQPADTALTATATGVDPIVLDSSKEDRAREGLLTLPARSAKDRTLTFRAAPGQGFVLRTLAPGQMLDSPGLNPVSVDRTGRYLLSVESP
ncbi:MAG TPA: lysozyme inhibitor LprI family protein, partial [Rhodopila sp.]|uniref:lysozyme inhibitor LprI family protein n=1 Tax=Rhodopila sp. TaxID=2480087 RepID=UPI002B957420